MESKERSESGGIRFHRYTMKKNTGSIAIPFLITLLVSFVIIGGIIFFLFGGFGGGGDSLKQLEPEITLRISSICSAYWIRRNPTSLCAT